MTKVLTFLFLLLLSYNCGKKGELSIISEFPFYEGIHYWELTGLEATFAGIFTENTVNF